MGINNPENEESYSKLQNQVSLLKKSKKILLEENEKIKMELQKTTSERDELKKRDIKTKELIKSFKIAMNNYENPAE